MYSIVSCINVMCNRTARSYTIHTSDVSDPRDHIMYIYAIRRSRRLIPSWPRSVDLMCVRMQLMMTTCCKRVPIYIYIYMQTRICICFAGITRVTAAVLKTSSSRIVKRYHNNKNNTHNIIALYYPLRSL